MAMELMQRRTCVACLGGGGYLALASVRSIKEEKDTSVQRCYHIGDIVIKEARRGYADVERVKRKNHERSNEATGVKR